MFTFQLDNIYEDNRYVRDKQWAIILLWKRRVVEDDKSPAVKELYDALTINKRADVALILFKEAEKHYMS